MNALLITAFAVLVTDQAVTLMLHRFVGAHALPLGRFGTVRVVAGRLWLRRLCGQCSGLKIWCLWVAAAVPLLVAGILVPACAPFAGLLLGGSLSHAVENSMRGDIADYICLRFWPAFNLADVALAAGAAGMVWQLLGLQSVVAF